MRLTSEPPKPKTIGDLAPGSLCRIRRTGAARNVPTTTAPLLVMEADEEDDDDMVVAVDTEKGAHVNVPSTTPVVELSVVLTEVADGGVL